MRTIISQIGPWAIVQYPGEAESSRFHVEGPLHGWRNGSDCYRATVKELERMLRTWLAAR